MTDDRLISIKEVLAEIDVIPTVKAEGHEFVEKTCLKTRVGLLPSAHQVDKDIHVPAKDCISRQGVLRLLNAVPSEEFATKAMPPAQPGWIPCSKKLPEPNQSVLVQSSDDFVDPILIMTFNISKCEGDFFYFWRTLEMGIDFDMDAVVAWMPLPKPWEGGQDENN